MRPPLHRLAAFAVVGLAALVVAPTGSAHVTVHPNALPAGGFAAIVVRVPNEEAKANTTTVDVKFPSGFLSVSYQPMPGWKTKITYNKLPKPVTTAEGETVTEEVDEVVWSGGKLAPGQYLDFPLSVLIPEDAKGLLTFKVLQIYDSGKVVRWIGAPDATEPAPRVLVTAKTAPAADYPEGPPATASTAGQTTTTSVQVGPTIKNDDSKTRANIAIALGAAGLAAGLGALALALARRRARTA